MKYIKFIILLFFLTTMFLSCEEESENIPTSWENSVDFINEGWAYYANGQYEDAIDSFEEVIARQSGNLEAHVGIAWSYYHLDNLDNAKAKFSFIVSMASINNDLKNLSNGYAGLSLTGIKTKILYEDEGEPESNILDVKLNDIIYNGNKVIEIDPQYAHEYESDIINAKNILINVAQTYFNIYYFYDSVLKLNLVESTFLDLLITNLDYESKIDTFLTSNLDDNDRLFLNWSVLNVITVDEVTSADGAADPTSFFLIDGSDLKLLPNELDIFSEQLTVQDSVIEGDTLSIVIPTRENVYQVESATESTSGYSVSAEAAVDENDIPLDYIIISDLSSGIQIEITYRYNRKVSVSYKKAKTNADFYQYLDLITGKLFELKTS